MTGEAALDPLWMSLGFSGYRPWLAAGAAIALLSWPCWRYRRYKAAHPDGWTRYV
ncbi:MAG: hypothetical protein IPJ34_02885 [Myxococcales bacterium]|nr:hypothetical protein [Myxococcales bacterium]